jgi:hypothetical protein
LEAFARGRGCVAATRTAFSPPGFRSRSRGLAAAFGSAMPRGTALPTGTAAACWVRDHGDPTARVFSSRSVCYHVEPVCRSRQKPFSLQRRNMSFPPSHAAESVHVVSGTACVGCGVTQGRAGGADGIYGSKGGLCVLQKTFIGILTYITSSSFDGCESDCNHRVCFTLKLRVPLKACTDTHTHTHTENVVTLDQPN